MSRGHSPRKGSRARGTSMGLGYYPPGSSTPDPYCRNRIKWLTGQINETKGEEQREFQEQLDYIEELVKKEAVKR